MAQIVTIEQLRGKLAEPNPLTRAKLRTALDEQARDFIARAPFLLLATRNEDGTLEVSPKGDVPGFVHVEDERTLLLPDRAGNNLAFGLTNILREPQVGLIFLLPGTGETLRVSGTAAIHDDADLCERLSARGAPAKLVIRIAVTRTFFHCAKALLRSGLWMPDAWPEAMKVSFGRILAEARPDAGVTADQIDTRVREGYRTTL